jgi:hypothetical protein
MSRVGIETMPIADAHTISPFAESADERWAINKRDYGWRAVAPTGPGIATGPAGTALMAAPLAQARDAVADTGWRAVA